jgi:orotate phosphoribosyltransferase
MGLPVVAVARLTDVIDYLAGQPTLEQNLVAVRRYRETYGVV